MAKSIQRDQAYDSIKGMIISGELASGMITSVSELANQLQLGRSPIRDAILRLNDDGFVQVLPRKGILISGIQSKDIKEMFQLRLAIEHFALDYISRTANSSFFEQLNEIVSKQDEVASAGLDDHFRPLDEDFHFFLVSQLNNRRINDILDESRRQMHLYGFKGITAHQDAKESVEEHQRIVSALISGEIEVAKEEMTQHLMKAQNCVLLS